jgi:hypothetical protein
MQFIATVDECMELTSSEKEWPATTSHGHYEDLAWIQNPGWGFHEWPEKWTTFDPSSKRSLQLKLMINAYLMVTPTYRCNHWKTFATCSPDWHNIKAFGDNFAANRNAKCAKLPKSRWKLHKSTDRSSIKHIFFSKIK